MPAPSTLHHRRRFGTIITAASVLLLGFSGIGASVSAEQNTSAPPVIEETFVLKYLKPSALVTFLTQSDRTPPAAKPGAAAPRTASTSVLLPASIKSVTPDDVFNTVTIQGAPETIAAIRKVATLLDVPPQPVRLTVRIIRYRSVATQKGSTAGTAPLADVEEVASGVVETPSNLPVELTTYGDRHTFRARLIPHINNAASVSVAADLQMAAPDGTFVTFSLTPSGTRQLRIGDRGLITSVGTGIGVSALSGGANPANTKGAKTAEKAAPETYYLEATPSFPPPPVAASSAEMPAAKP